MRFLPFLLPCAALPPLLALSACTEGGPAEAIREPVAIEGRWAVVALGNRPLPITNRYTDPSLGACMHVFEAMELRFLGDLHYSGSVSTSTRCDRLPEETETESYGGTYRVIGSAVYTRLDGQPVDFEEEMVWSVTGNTLTLRETVGLGVLVYVLERQ